MSASGDHDRQIGNLVMVGTVQELDESAALVRVNVDGMLSDWIPWATSRAGPGAREWTAPEVGEQVVMAAPYGDPAQAVVIGSIYQDAHGAPAALKTTHRNEYADGTFVQYDRAAHELLSSVTAAGKIRLLIGGSEITMTTDKISLSSNGSTLELDAAGIRLNGAKIDLN